MKTRIEIDPLGEKAIPESAYYGIQTLRATENFPVSGIKAPVVFIKAYVLVKKVAALANAEVGWLDEKHKQAIPESQFHWWSDSLTESARHRLRD